MMSLRTTLRTSLVFLSTACLALAADAPAKEKAANAPKSVLKSTLVDPINVDLTWQTDLPNVEGHFVDFRSNPDEEYIILGILPAEHTTYRHPDLAPETRFIYRVRPYLGKAAKPVEFTTGKSPENPAEGLVGDNEPVTETPAAEALARQKSLRDDASLDAAAPTELTATPINPVSYTLRWKDNAKDEEGYLMEISPDANAGWMAIALLPKDCVSFTLLGLPEHSKCFVRVRAYYHGPESNSTEHTTGKEPPGYFEQKMKETEAAEAEARKAEEAAKAAAASKEPAKATEAEKPSDKPADKAAPAPKS